MNKIGLDASCQSLHQTIGLGIAQGSTLWEANLRSWLAPFSAGCTAADASTLPSSPQVWLWSQKGVVVNRWKESLKVIKKKKEFKVYNSKTLSQSFQQK